MLCMHGLNSSPLQHAELGWSRAVGAPQERARNGSFLVPSNPDYSAADIMMGWAETKGTGSRPEALMSYTANRLKDKVAISKEKRKALDEPRLGGKGKPGNGEEPDNQGKK